jgi:IclR family KDG regulon transcriptional repressor
MTLVQRGLHIKHEPLCSARVVANQQVERAQGRSETSLSRGLEILMALGGNEAISNGGLGVVRIARLVDREPSQVSRALKALADSGLVDRDPATRSYRLGWNLFTLAARAGDRRLLTGARPLLEDLVARLGETAHLSVLEGAEVVTVLSEASPSAIRASSWERVRVPAYCTSAGRALLFDHDRRLLDGLYPRGALPAQGKCAPLDVAELHRRIVAARIKGYALVDQELQPGLVGIAAPVRDFRGRIVAALNVSAPKFRFGAQLDTTGGPEIKQAAGELSRQLGSAGRSQRFASGEPHPVADSPYRWR